MPPTALTRRLIRTASVVTLVGMAALCASAQSVVFTPSGANHIANAAGSPTDTSHQAYINRVAVNQRGDIFWVNAPYTYGGLAFDASGNVWSVTSGSNALVFTTKAGTTSAASE